MPSKISLRNLKNSDIHYFAKWWRDKELLKLTSGILRRMSDKEVKKYFQKMINDKKSHHYMIVFNKKKMIGHISLTPRRNNWYETQIVIGDKEYQNKGYGTDAIKQLVQKAKTLGVQKIYLEVRPTNKRATRAYRNCGFQEAGFKKYPKNKYLPITLKMIKII